MKEESGVGRSGPESSAFLSYQFAIMIQLRKGGSERK